MAAVPVEHISLDAQGVAWIRNTTTKVIEVVLDQNAYGLSPAQIHAEHPHLSLAQIYAALSYYYDHKTEMDEEIARRYQEVERLRSQAANQLTRKELDARRQKTGNPV